MLLLSLLLACTGEDTSVADPPTPQEVVASLRAPGEFQVAYRESALTYDAVREGPRTLRLALWYPTEDVTGAEVRYRGLFPAPGVLGDATVAEGQFPLLVFAHGHQGFAENSARIVVPADFDPDKPILNEIALAIYGSYLLDQVEFELLGPTPETVCAGDYEILDTATYVLDGDDRTVYIAVNKFEGFVLALDVDTCTELAMGSLF